MWSFFCLETTTAVLVMLVCLMASHMVSGSPNPMAHLTSSNRQWWSSMSTGSRAVPALSTKRLNQALSDSVEQVSTKLKKRKQAPIGYYYGIPPHVLQQQERQPKKRERLSDVMSEALQELKEMRQEMEALRREMITMQRRLGGKVGGDEGELLTAQEPIVPAEDDHSPRAMLARRKRAKDFERVSMDVEQWGENLLWNEGAEEDGWKEVKCSKLFRKKFNANNNIKCYMKWMKDSRGAHAVPDDDQEYPCIKCYATLDAPMDKVCTYLAEERHVPEYNDLMIAHRDLEEITPHSKICWGQAPQILFIKSRDFVTYCSHRWLRDGTQVVINQACDHPDAPGNTDEKSGKVCRARALRGANFISPDPDDPENKTRFALIGHADPGGIPQWATRTAVNAVAPIEPFKLFHRIGEYSKRIVPPLDKTEMVHTVTGRSLRPAGLSQLGYACFWKNGGGPTEGILHHEHPEHTEPSEHQVHD